MTGSETGGLADSGIVKNVPDSGGRVVAVLLIILAGVPTSLVENHAQALVVAALAAVCVWLAKRWRLTALADAALVVGIFQVAMMVPALLWPIPAYLGLFVAALLARREGRWHEWRSWLRRGHVDPTGWVLVAVLILGTACALLVWRDHAQAQLNPAYAEAARGVPVWLAVLGALAFLIMNGAAEDSIWSGLLLTASEEARIPVWIGLPLVAASFGLAHLHGTPSGLLGVAMAGFWGLLLGLLRVRTGGMLATYVAHVAADATIVFMLLPAALG